VTVANIKKITMPARPDPTANKYDAGSLTIVANDTGPRVSVSRLTRVGNYYPLSIISNPSQ
jgi:hypothetical protein